MGERLQPVSSVPDLDPPNPFTPYKFTSGISLAAVPVQDDNRSVHNDNDIQKIQTLESELEAQKTKLNQIMSLLGKNNLI